MKNYSIFAASSPKTVLVAFVCVAIFMASHTALYAVEYGLSNSNGCCAAKPVIVFGETEKGSLSSLFKYFNFSFMPKTMKNASRVKHSNRTSTPTERNTVSYSKFLIEKDAKNRAYHFILSHGLLDRFAEFCRNVHVNDPHAACISILSTQIQEAKS